MQQAEPETIRGTVAALIVATAPGGSQQTRDLLWRPVLGRPLVAWPFEAVARLDTLTTLYLTTPSARREAGVSMMSNIVGPLHRQAVPVDDISWSYALEAFVGSAHVQEDWIILVDAALPLVTTASLRAGLQAASQTGVAIAGEPVKETLKRVDGQRVAETLPRERLRRLISPLTFSHDALIGIYKTLRDHPSTSADLVDVAQMAGVPLTVFDVDYPCVRITTEHDLAIVESLLRQRESERS